MLKQNDNEKTKSSCLKITKKKPEFTNEDLERFRNDPKHNPQTGRVISEKGTIYKQLKRELDSKDKMNTLQNIPPKVIVKKFRPKGLATLFSRNEQK